MKKKLIALGLSIALIGVSAVSGSLAYLTDSEEATNVFAVGNVEIEIEDTVSVWGIDTNGDEYDCTAQKYDETTDSYHGIIPTNKINKAVKVINKGNTDAYIRVAVILNNKEAIEGALKYAVNYNANPKYTVQDVFYGWNDTFEAGYSFNAANKDSSGTQITELLTPDSTKLPAIDAITHADEIGWLYYFKLEDGEKAQIFGGLESLAIFDKAQNAMFSGLKIEIYADAIQAEGFMGDTPEKIAGSAFEALEEAHPLGAIERAGTVKVANNDELKAALTADVEKIVVDLTADVTYDAAAWQTNAMGGASTKLITIIGNGHTLTFNNTNSDWDNVVTNNDAKLYLKNVVLTNSGYGATDAPWNRHDINFACDVELHNVNSLNAIALKSDAVLENVTITDDHTGDSYMLWISARGQNVVIDGCTIDASGTGGNDRGIKIDDQYVAAEENGKVTLSVSNTKFITESKAAILVKSPAGADITVQNIDITGCAADKTNAVWVDSDASAYFDLVTVTGATKIKE